MRKRRRGFMIFDALLAMGICGVMLTVIAAGVNSQQKASRRLADYRAATRLAEQSLARMQQGLVPAALASEDQLTVENVDQSPSPDHFKWVRVTASHNGCSVQLLGLTRTEAGGK
jgi:type II secretory pathway component PulJ